ncbi:MAG: hypothetical protein V8P98_04845 [Acutalibacteraceae bacterium]|jgi:hypothetical protein
MSDFELDVQDFMDGRLDDVISDLEKKNPEYKECKKDEKKSVDKFGEVIDRMPKEDQDFIKKHEMNVFNIMAMEQSYVYYRGYKDCVKLLKILGVI